ncbi:MAG: sensor histidine kinase [Nitrospiraceae bacterium]
MTTELGKIQGGVPALRIALAMAAAILPLDFLTPQEMPAQFLYVLCILVSVWSHREHAIWAMAILCTGLTVLASYLSPPTFDLSVILFNRITAILLLWLTAVLVWQYRQTHERLLLMKKELEARVEQRTQELSRVFEEREQLNRNLHDDILQSLYAVGLNLEASHPPQTTDFPQLTAHLNQALNQLKLVMRQIRTYIAGPQPARDEGQPFDVALATLVLSMTHAQGPHLRLTIDPGLSDSVSREQAESILHFVREALSNCVRHSHAHQGFVTAQRQNGFLRIEIQDDGVGFNPDAAKKDGQGLSNMSARARALGAEFKIASGPGHGVHIALDLPLPQGSFPS